jgi:ribosomal protein L14E/L6E/L27E
LIGRLVYSQTGRDAGKAFVVIRTDEKGFVLLADGDIRKVEKPKSKNPKHIRFTHYTLDEVREMLLKGEQPENHFLRTHIRQLLVT